MAAWAGLRNVLVLLYLDVDNALLWRILAEDLDDLEQFAAAIAGAGDFSPPWADRCEVVYSYVRLR